MDDKEDHYAWTLTTYFYGVLGNFARNFTQIAFDGYWQSQKRKSSGLKNTVPKQ